MKYLTAANLLDGSFDSDGRVSGVSIMYGSSGRPKRRTPKANRIYHPGPLVVESQFASLAALHRLANNVRPSVVEFVAPWATPAWLVEDDDDDD